MQAVARFATSDVAPGDRLRSWNALTADIGISTDARTAPFRGELWRWMLGELVLARPRSNAAIVTGVAGTAPGDERRLILHLQHRGHMRQYQGGRESSLGPGEIALLSASDPYRLELSANHEILAVELPERLLRPHASRLEDHLGRVVAGTFPASRMLHDFLLSLWRVSARARHDAAWAKATGAVLLDLIVLALRASAEPAVKRPGLQCERLLDLVEARLYDPDLRAGSMAVALGVSIRTIQNAFGSIATTPTAYVLEQRLARAAERLRIAPDESITAIAFDLGFNDSAYFTRCFRKRFGYSPSAWRGGHAT